MMAQQQNSFACSRTKVGLHMIARKFLAMHLDPPTQRCQSSCQHSSNLIPRRLVVTGRFNLNQFADGCNHLLLPRFKIAQPFRRTPYAVGCRLQFQNDTLNIASGTSLGVAGRRLTLAVQYNPMAQLVPAMTEITTEIMTETTTETTIEITTGTIPPTAEAVAAKTTLDINEIQKLLPHRYPFLLIDRIVELIRKERIVAIKNVTINEPFFQGHFPGQPIMPGVLIVEAIAQAGCALLLTEIPNRDEVLVVFTGIERAKFRRPVVPGDQLRIEVTVKSWRSTAGRMEGIAYVGDKKAAEAIVTCRLVPRVRKAAEKAESESGPDTGSSASADGAVSV